MIVWPGLRRSVSAIQRLFNSASFYAPLTHSAIPVRAAAGTTATFTRATPKTVENNDGYLVTLLAGEIGFPGARRVRNLLPSSENLTVGFTATGSTLAAGSITESGATSGHYAQTTSMVIPATAIFIMQAEIKQSVGTRNIGIGTNSVGNAIFNPSTGVFVANDGVTLDHGTGAQTADGYWPVWVKVQATTSNKPIISLYSGTTQSYAGDGASQVLVRKFQVEDVTAQTTQTAGEYVSVGVESAPYYHGSFVDGVKCFPTDLAGNALTTMRRYNAEGARTNLCLQSQFAVTTAPWALANLTSTVNAVAAPDGTITAVQLKNDGVLTAHEITQSVSLSASSTYTVSVFAKPKEITWMEVLTTNKDGNSWVSYFDLSNIAKGTTDANHTTTITALTNGWCRVTVSFASGTGATAPSFRFGLATSSGGGTRSFAGTVNDSLYLWGAQVELGPFASSYIPTTTAAVTRNADVLTYSSAGNIAASEGWIYCEPSVSDDVVAQRICVRTWAYNPGDGLSGISLEVSEGSTGPQMFSAGAGVINGSAVGSTPANSITKLAGSFGLNNLKVAANGVIEGTDTSAAVPTSISGATIYVGIASDGVSAPLFGNIGPIYIGQRQLSASEMQAITAA